MNHVQCENCLDEGTIEIDEPGYAYNRTVYCDCMAGYRLRQHDESPYWAHVNDGIDRLMDKRRGV